MSSTSPTTTTTATAAVEEDVMRIKKKLEKMMKSNEIDVNISIDMLSTLKKLQIDLQILKTTGIGVVLNSLRKSCNSEELGTLAKGLLKNWKKLVPNETTTTTTTTTTPTNTNVSSPNSNSNDSSSKQPISPVSTPPATTNAQQSNGNSSLKRTLSDSPTDNHQHPAKHHAESTSTSSSNGKVGGSVAKSISVPNDSGAGKKFNRSQSYPEVKDPIRLKCREMLSSALELVEPCDDSACMLDCGELAARCEEAVYQEFKNTDAKYKTKYEVAC
jgi:transcription elongation factor S-II